MIIWFILFTLFSLSQTTEINCSNQDRCFGKLISLFPYGYFKEFLSNVEKDSSLENAIRYFQSSAWETLLEEVRNDESWTKYKSFLLNLGIDVTFIIRNITQGIKEINNTKDSTLIVDHPPPNTDINVPSMVLMKTVSNTTFMKAVLEELNDDDCKRCLEKLRSPESMEMFNTSVNLPVIRKLFMALKKLGADIDQYIIEFRTLFGWNTPTTESNIF